MPQYTRLGLYGGARSVLPLSITIEVPAGALTYTAQIPTITTGGNQSVQIPAGALTYTGQVATVTTSAGVSVEIPAGSLIYTGQVATVTASALVSIEIPVGALSYTGQVPSIVVSGAVAGGTYNAVEYFPTGQSDVVITLYDPAASGATAISLDSNACTEIGTTGLYVWDISNITTLPVPYKEYAYLMTDGATSSGGVITYDEFFDQFLVHNAMLN